LFVTRGLIWCGVATEAQRLFVDNQIDVFRKTLNQFPRFGERGAALECEVFPNSGEQEKLSQRPANPKVFFHANSLKPYGFVDLPEGIQTANC
jgi:hypothetical protein